MYVCAAAADSMTSPRSPCSAINVTTRADFQGNFVLEDAPVVPFLLSVRAEPLRGGDRREAEVFVDAGTTEVNLDRQELRTPSSR